jgi:eukaryotic-like serine/threonine-protein kinase
MEPTADVDFTGTTIDHYDVVALIQAGGQGRVYHGRDQRLRRDVAIKVLGGSCAPDRARRRGLISEAQALSRLNHPHVAGVYDFVTEDDRDFMVMEYVAGATLAEIVASGPLPPPEVGRLGAQLARGLAAAHDAGVIHCDVKPGNLKITSRGELKILDFGIARLTRGGVLLDPGARTATDAPLRGTIPYMAPEQLRGERPDERTDIFSAGAVLYEMATGRPAFPQRSLARLVHAIEHDDPAPASDLNPLVPIALERVIRTAMRKDPRQRHAGAAALGDALDALTSSGAGEESARVESWWGFLPALH